MQAYDVWVDMENPELGLTSSDVVTVRAMDSDEAEEKAVRKFQNWLGYGTKVEVSAVATNMEH